MSGKRAKQLRQATGHTIAMRRDQRVFERQITRVIEQRTDTRARSRRVKRAALAWGGLIVIVVSVLAGLFL